MACQGGASAVSASSLKGQALGSACRRRARDRARRSTSLPEAGHPTPTQVMPKHRAVRTFFNECDEFFHDKTFEEPPFACHPDRPRGLDRGTCAACSGAGFHQLFLLDGPCHPTPSSRGKCSKSLFFALQYFHHLLERFLVSRVERLQVSVEHHRLIIGCYAFTARVNKVVHGNFEVVC